MTNIFEVLFASKFFWSAPIVLAHLFFVLLVVFYCKRYLSGAELFKKQLKVVILTIIGARFAYSIFLTISQFYVWSKNDISKLFLSSSVPDAVISRIGITAGLLKGKLGYFYLYSFNRFWLGVIVSVFVAYIFYLFLRALKKHNERFFEDGELELGFALALMVGWPGFVIFLPAIFVFVILISLFRSVVLKQKLITLGYPFVFAGAATLILGNFIIDLLDWGVLKI